jgi:F-type H+-transporting ATPase subunit b
MKIKAIFASASLFMAPALAFAQEAASEAAKEAGAEGAAAEHVVGAHAHTTGVPFSVALQAINFAIYIALLVWLLRKPVANFFRTREQIYKQAVMKAESAKRDAEKKKRDMQQRLSQLEASSEEALSNARAEAAALMLQIQQDAEAMANRLRDEAGKTASIEIERARTEIREEMLTQALALSRKVLEDKMAEPDQKRLQTEFVTKIEEKTLEVR